MPLDVRAVVRNRAERECILVQVARLLQHDWEEIRAAYVVEKVAEKAGAEWVVSEILDNASAVGVAVRNPQLLFGGIGEALEQDNFDRIVPEGIDERLVGEYGISWRRLREGKQHERQK
jgi:hypothetical protein